MLRGDDQPEGLRRDGSIDILVVVPWLPTCCLRNRFPLELPADRFWTGSGPFAPRKGSTLEMSNCAPLLARALGVLSVRGVRKLISPSWAFWNKIDSLFVPKVLSHERYPARMPETKGAANDVPERIRSRLTSGSATIMPAPGAKILMARPNCDPTGGSAPTSDLLHVSQVTSEDSCARLAYHR